jgi:hypothetical protein
MRSLRLGCALAFAIATAPGVVRADETQQTTTTTPTTTETKATGVYDHWSTRGGATLGEGFALRVQVGGGTANNINNGYLNAEAGMLFALGKNFDIGFNLRVPMFQLGVSPGLAMRWQLVHDNAFHLSLVGNLQVPMIFVPGFWLGLSVEPGLMVSYFFNERTELYTGVYFIYSPLFINPWVPGTGHAGFAGLFRLGLAYTLSDTNVGFFANFDVGAGYEPVRRFIQIGDRASGLAFNASVTVGSQFKF